MRPLLFSALICFVCFSVALGSYIKISKSDGEPRAKREVSGSLDIVNAAGQPIHEDVKSDEKQDPTSKITTELKSLRKSLPFTNKLDLVRNVSRVGTLVVLIVSAVVEFLPLLLRLVRMIRIFLA